MIAPAGSDRGLIELGAKMHYAASVCLGVSTTATPAPAADVSLPDDYVAVAVCGAHMSGLPLNHQLTQRNAFLLSASRTAPVYRFFALPGGPPQRPGLIRVANGGAAVDVEVWAVPQQHFGSFVAGIPSPLGIGKIELANGTSVSGFLCESWAIDGAQEITTLGGWRSYLASLR